MAFMSPYVVKSIKTNSLDSNGENGEFCMTNFFTERSNLLARKKLYN